MIKHIVVWQLKEQADGRSKIENAVMIKTQLEALKDCISEIQEIEVGINCIDSEQAYDVVLVSTFKSVSDLNAYQVHPEHERVAKFIGSVREGRIVVDYEV